MEPRMGAQRRTHFNRLAFFFVLGGLGSQNDPQGLLQEPPGPVQASMFIDFAAIFDGFVNDVLYHVAHLLSSLPLFLLPRALLCKFLANCGRRHGGGKAEAKWLFHLLRTF